jgi:hypothetical protein
MRVKNKFKNNIPGNNDHAGLRKYDSRKKKHDAFYSIFHSLFFGKIFLQISVVFLLI